MLSAASFAALGACLTLPGTLLPLIVDRFGIRLVEAGSMLALQPIGYLLSVGAAGYCIRAFGVRAALIGGLLTAAAGFAAFGTVSGWIGGALTMFVAGLGFGVMEVAINALLIAIGGERRSNLLNFAHLFFGVGSFVAPVVTAQAVAAGVSWRLLFALAGGLTAAVGLGWRGLPSGEAAGVTVATGAPAGSALRSHLAVLLACMLGLYVGTEMGIGTWLTKYLISTRSFTLTGAGTALSLYWLGLAAGRLVLSLSAHRVRDEWLLVGLTLLALAALASGLLVTTPAAVLICFTATGVGFSGIFPVVVALGGRRHPSNVAAVTAVLITGAGIGNIVIPWAMSAIADRIGLVVGMSFYLAMTAVMALLAAVVLRIARQPTAAETALSSAAP